MMQQYRCFDAATTAGVCRHKARIHRGLRRKNAHRIAQQVLVEGVGAEAQEVFERQVAGEGREALPQGPDPLLTDNGAAAVVNACAAMCTKACSRDGEGRKLRAAIGRCFQHNDGADADLLW